MVHYNEVVVAPHWRSQAVVVPYMVWMLDYADFAIMFRDSQRGTGRMPF
jgi:hypothetical protein